VDSPIDTPAVLHVAIKALCQLDAKIITNSPYACVDSLPRAGLTAKSLRQLLCHTASKQTQKHSATQKLVTEQL